MILSDYLLEIDVTGREPCLKEKYCVCSQGGTNHKKVRRSTLLTSRST